MFPRRYHAPRLVTEAPEDPLLSFLVPNAFVAINVVAFNGDAALALAMQFLTLAEKKGTTTHLMLAHRGMGVCVRCIEVTSRKPGGISNRQLHFMIALNMVSWRRDLAKTRGPCLGLPIVRELVSRLSRGRASRR
jgi:hypothetical protein